MTIESTEHRLAGLALSLRDVGGVLLPADSVASDPFETDTLFLMRSLCASPYARSFIARAVARLSVGSESATEPMFGMLVVPVRLPRLLAGGRFVAVTLLDEGIEGETLDILAQRAGIDARIARTLLRSLPPWERRTSGRFANVVSALARSESERLAGLEAGAQLSTAWEELHLLHSLSNEMAVGTSPREFARRTLDEVRHTLGCRWTALRVDGSAAAILDVEPGSLLVSGADITLAEQLLGAVQTPQSAAVVGTDLVLAPVRREGEYFGVLAAGDRRVGDCAMSNCERTLVETAAGNLSVFIDNARLYRDLDRMFIGALSALVSAIDAKDPYTRGHSQRVALLSRQIAMAAGLSAADVKHIYISGLVHDVGKIGVPETALRKQGKLTNEEYGQVKQHPVIGWRILRDIPRFEPVLDGVLHHHERFDGRGYPHELAGDTIPVAARIIAIADTFDAMSSNRTYRAKLGRSEVLNEMSKLGGSQFDPTFLAHFLRLDLSTYDVGLEDCAASGSGDASSLDAVDASSREPLSIDSIGIRNLRRLGEAA